MAPSHSPRCWWMLLGQLQRLSILVKVRVLTSRITGSLALPLVHLINSDSCYETQCECHLLGEAFLVPPDQHISKSGPWPPGLLVKVQIPTQTDPCTHMFTALSLYSVIHHRQNAVATQVSINKWTEKHNTLYVFNGIVVSHQEEGNYGTGYDMGEHCASGGGRNGEWLHGVSDWEDEKFWGQRVLIVAQQCDCINAIQPYILTC